MSADPHSVDGRIETERFARLTFDSFAAMARDAALSEHERMGFPDALRAGFDAALELLMPGGRLLVSDILDASKLRRFLASEAGVVYHKAYMRTDQPPELAAIDLLVERP